MLPGDWESQLGEYLKRRFKGYDTPSRTCLTPTVGISSGTFDRTGSSETQWCPAVSARGVNMRRMWAIAAASRSS